MTQNDAHGDHLKENKIHCCLCLCIYKFTADMKMCFVQWNIDIVY